MINLLISWHRVGLMGVMGGSAMTGRPRISGSGVRQCRSALHEGGGGTQRAAVAMHDALRRVPNDGVRGTDANGCVFGSDANDGRLGAVAVAERNRLPWQYYPLRPLPE